VYEAPSEHSINRHTLQNPMLLFWLKSIVSHFIQETSIVDEHAQIGDGTKIWHFSHIMSKAKVGKHCTIGQNVFVADNVIIGDHVKIQNNVSIYDGVVCEDEVFIGPSVVFTNVINPRSAVERKEEYKTTIIRKGATIGANATIVCGIQLGVYCFIGAGAVVTKDVKAFELVTGNPAKHTGWMSEAGGKLLFTESAEAVCILTKDVYELKNGIVYKTKRELL
jgi:UDP-2-acetamido-3-amino-2,3-dideoxy-glucuronate N-acetyltransferase